MPTLFASLRMFRWLGVSAAAFACLPVAAALAAEGGEGGLPQLNPHVFPTQIFWLAIGFVALYWLMIRRALPAVETVLEERANRIAKDLDEAASQKDKAAALQAEVEKAMAAARANAQAEVGTIVATAEQAARERHAVQNADIAARVNAAEKRLGTAKADAIAHIATAVGDLSRDIAARLAGVTVGEAQVTAAVDSAIKERG